jgi:hypothetical protein
MSIASGYYYLQPQCGVSANLVAGRLRNQTPRGMSADYPMKMESLPCLVTQDAADWTCIHHVIPIDGRRYRLQSWSYGINAVRDATKALEEWGADKANINHGPAWNPGVQPNVIGGRHYPQPNMSYEWDFEQVSDEAGGPWYAIRLAENLDLNLGVAGSFQSVPGVGTELQMRRWEEEEGGGLFVVKGGPYKIWRFIPAPEPVVPSAIDDTYRQPGDPYPSR